MARNPGGMTMMKTRGNSRWSGWLSALLLFMLAALPLAVQAQESEQETALDALASATDQNVGEHAAQILDSLDRDTVLRQAKKEIQSRLGIN